MPTVTGYADPLGLGRLLRASRQQRGLTLRAVSHRAGISVTTLSRLERGERALRRPELLDAVAVAAGADVAEAFRLAGMLPPDSATKLLGADVSRVLEGGLLGAAAWEALRREHLGRLAEALAVPAGAVPVDIAAIAFEGLALDSREDEGAGWLSFATAELITLPGGLTERERRFRLAHGAGHALIARESGRRPDCRFAVGGRAEAEASYLASMLLMPREELHAELSAVAGSYDVTGPEAPMNIASLIEDLAGAFQVPEWVVADRVGRDGLVAWVAGMEIA